MLPNSYQIVSKVVATVPIPQAGRQAAKLENDLNLKNIQTSRNIDRIFSQLATLMPQPPDGTTSADKVNFINDLQTHLANFIEQLGAPPEKPYTTVSSNLALTQWSISQAIVNATDHETSGEVPTKYNIDLLDTSKRIRSILEQNNLFDQFIDQFANLRQPRANILESATISEPQRQQLEPLKKLPGAKRPLTQRINFRSLAKSALVLTLISICARPPQVFNFASQWDGGAANKQLVEQATQSSSSIELNDPRNSPAFTQLNQRLRPETPTDLSSDDRLSLEDRQKSRSSRSPLSDFLLIAALYYLARRYIIRTLSEKYQGALRPRHEGVHRQIRSPFRGRPIPSVAGCIETENKTILDRLWVTSVWDPVSVNSFYRLDRDTTTVKLNRRGFRAWFTHRSTVNSASQAIRLPLRSHPQTSAAQINSESRGPGYLRFLFPRGLSLTRNFSWKKVDNLAQIADLGERESVQADVKLPIAVLPGRTIAIPVPLGFGLIAIDLPKGATLWQSDYGTWELRGKLLSTGQIKYRIAPSAPVSVSANDIDYLSREAKIALPSEKMEAIVARAIQQDSPHAIVSTLLRELRSIGARLTYSPLHDHARTVKPRSALTLFDAYPDHSEESLAMTVIHKARACGVPAALLSGFRLTHTEQATAFVMSEWSSSILIKNSSDQSDQIMSEVDIYPIFPKPEDHKPQSLLRDLGIGIATKLRSIFAGEAAAAKRWSARYERDVVDNSDQVSAALDAPIWGRFLLDPTKNSQLGENELIAKVQLARLELEESGDPEKFALPINQQRLAGGTELIELNVASLQQRLIEKAKSERATRWWSRRTAPLDSYALLQSCTQVSESLESTPLRAALSVQQAAQVFFAASEFQLCFRAHKYKYVKQLFAFLDCSEAVSDNEFAAQQEFVADLVVGLNKRSLWSQVKVPRQYKSGPIELGKDAFQPALSWIVKACAAGQIDAQQGAEQFAEIVQALRRREGVVNENYLKRALIESIFAPENHLVAYGNTAVFGHIIKHLAQDQYFEGLINSNGSPLGSSLQHLLVCVNSVCRAARTDREAQKLVRARKIIETFEQLGLEFDQISAALAAVPTRRLADPLDRFIPPTKVPLEALQAELAGATGLPIKIDMQFAAETAQGASLLLRDALQRINLPIPAAIEANITAPNENLLFVTTLPKSFNTFRVYYKGRESASFELPDSQVWRIICPKSAQYFSDYIEADSPNSLARFSRKDLFNSDLIASILVREHLEIFPHGIHREIAWAFHLLSTELAQLPVETDFKAVTEKIWSDWTTNKIDRESVGFVSLAPLKALLLYQTHSLHDQANLLVSACLELGAKEITDIAGDAPRSVIESRLGRYPASIFVHHYASWSNAKIDQLGAGNSVAAFFDLEDPSGQVDQAAILSRQQLIASINLTTSRRGLSSEAILSRDGIGERLTRLSGLDFMDLRPYQHGDESRQINQQATARSGTTIVNVFQQTEAYAYFALVSMSWLAHGVSDISMGSNIERLARFLQATYSDQMPTELVLHLDGEVVDRFTSRQVIQAMSSPHLTNEFIDRLLAHAQRMRDYELSFGQVSDNHCLLPMIPILGGVHPIIFSNASDPRSVYKQASRSIGHHCGCTVVGGSLPQFDQINIQEIVDNEDIT